MEPKTTLEDSVTYDITSWALPYAYGLKAFGVRDRVSFTAGIPRRRRPSVPCPPVPNRTRTCCGGRRRKMRTCWRTCSARKSGRAWPRRNSRWKAKRYPRRQRDSGAGRKHASGRRLRQNRAGRSRRGGHRRYARTIGVLGQRPRPGLELRRAVEGAPRSRS
jgi:hypothetical protein